MDGFRKKGSFTVEAVFVVPVCLMVVFFLLQTFFYLHHVSWYTAAAWECALTQMQDGPQKETASQRWQKISKEQLFPIAGVKESEQSKKLHVQVTVRGSQAAVMGLSALPFQIEAKRSWLSPAATLRRQKQLQQLADTGGGA